MTHQDQPPFAVPAQFAMPDFGHLGAGHFARLPDRILAAESRERLQEPGDDDVGQMLALQQVEPPGVAKTGIGAQMCDLGQLLRPGEDASDEAQRQILHRQRLAPPARDPCKVSLRMPVAGVVDPGPTSPRPATTQALFLKSACPKSDETYAQTRW